MATAEAVRIFNHEGAKALSWAMLNQPESAEAMGAEMGGECAKSNFALGVFEHALDWGLGLMAANYLKAFAERYPGKQPKEIRVACNRAGDCFIVNKENKIIFG